LEKSIFDNYKDRENTKLNLVIYGSFGFSAAALYLIANKSEIANIFVVTMYLLSLIFSLSSFFYWYVADILAYADYQAITDKNEDMSITIRPFQSKMALFCLLNILSSYIISFLATLLAFTSYKFIQIDKIFSDQLSWIIIISACIIMCSLIIYHYISYKKIMVD